MTLAASVLGIVPGLQATALVGYNLKALQNFKMDPSKKMNMKKPIKNMVKMGVGTMVGIGLLKPTASMINSIN